MDTPLRRWRHRRGITQAQLAELCGVTGNTIARYEEGRRIPRGAQLDRLIELTRLPTDALVRPKRYLEEHPNFLLRWASPEPPPRGRPRKHRQEIPSEEEGRS
jgi:transcriptional regulator with XRE-family HTH domain